MSLFGSLEKSTGAQFHLKASSSHTLRRGTRPMCASESRSCGINNRLLARRQCRPTRPAFGPIADIFINSLVIASYCKRHAPSNRSTSRTLSTASPTAPAEHPEPEHRTKTKNTPIEDKMGSSRTYSGHRKGAGSKRKAEPVAVKSSERKPEIDSSRHEPKKFRYVPLLNETSSSPRSDTSPYEQLLSTHPRYQDSRNLLSFYLGVLGDVEARESIQAVLSNRNREILLPATRNTQFLRDVIEMPEVEHLVTLLRENRVDNQAIFKVYKSLPKPGVSYLSEHTRGHLLHRLADPPKRRYIDARRYLAVFQDMRDADLHISPSLWTTAIYLTGRCSARTSRVDLKAALAIWREMEHQANIPSTSVTFNILFDIAIKAGQYMVADSLIEEMEKRGIEFSRCGRVTQIYLCGLKRDAPGIYQAYNNLIQAGEIVDTIVLNCVMTSLINAGEYAAAKNMYDRMKDVHQKASSHAPGYKFLSGYTTPPANFWAYRKASKRFGRLLGASAYLSKTHPEQHRMLQESVPLTPDSRTFHIFLSYHSHHSGDLQSFMSIVNDMEMTFLLPPQSMVYIFLFEGFARHGASKRNIWTYERLKSAWASFLRALHESKERAAEDYRVKKRREKMVWENLSNIAKGSTPDAEIPREKLPYFRFSSTRQNQSDGNQATDFSKEKDSESDREQDDEHDHANPNESNYAEGGLELDESAQGVYVGRRIVISCLRAFHVCGGPNATLEVWAKISRLWKAERRRVQDLIAVRAVLNKLMSSSGRK